MDKTERLHFHFSLSSSTMLKLLTAWITTNWKILREMGIPNHLTCLLKNLYADQEATVGTGCWGGGRDCCFLNETLPKWFQLILSHTSLSPHLTEALGLFTSLCFAPRISESCFKHKFLTRPTPEAGTVCSERAPSLLAAPQPPAPVPASRSAASGSREGVPGTAAQYWDEDTAG